MTQNSEMKFQTVMDKIRCKKLLWKNGGIPRILIQMLIWVLYRIQDVHKFLNSFK